MPDGRLIYYYYHSIDFNKVEDVLIHRSSAVTKLIKRATRYIGVGVSVSVVRMVGNYVMWSDVMEVSI